MASFASRISNLPSGYIARSPNRTDIKACTEVVRAVDIAFCGETTSTEIELEGDLFSHSVHGDRGTAVICKGEGVVGFINIFDELEDSDGVFFDIFLSPEISQEDAIAIANVLIENMESYATELMHEYGISEAPLKTALYESDFGLLKGLELHNYDYHRTYWRMKILHSDNQPTFSVPEGYEVTQFTHSEAALQEVHEVQTAAFADYYDFNPTSWENWQKWFIEPQNDSSTWRLVFKDGELVGYIMGNTRFKSENFGYVASLAVLREHRGKGIARALLLDMFVRDKKCGMVGTILHGDSANPTGAMKLYSSVGMETDRVYLGYRKNLSL